MALNALTLESLEEIGPLTHKIVEWVPILEGLAMSCATLSVTSCISLLLVAKIH